jgi:TIR domain
MRFGLDLHLLDRSQLREALSDAFQKLAFVRETVGNTPAIHIPFPKLQEISFLEQRVAEYSLELSRRRTADTPVRVFYCYSQRDLTALEELNKRLLELKDERPIEIFWDRNLPGGVEWYPQTMAELKDADVVLLLVSPEFLASRYCQQIELPAALNLHDCGLAVVIPIIIQTCPWQQTSLARLQAIPAGGTSILESHDPTTAWTQASRAILRKIDLVRRACQSS